MFFVVENQGPGMFQVLQLSPSPACPIECKCKKQMFTYTHTQHTHTHTHTHIQIEIRSNEPMLLYDERDVLLRLFNAGFWKERRMGRERARGRDRESQTDIDTETETKKCPVAMNWTRLWLCGYMCIFCCLLLFYQAIRTRSLVARNGLLAKKLCFGTMVVT
jgi:hypothetical protein